jgi:hypothetical protein
MPDNSILWLSAQGINPRMMVEGADGSQVYARYPWDPPPFTGLASPLESENLSVKPVSKDGTS